VLLVVAVLVGRTEGSTAWSRRASSGGVLSARSRWLLAAERLVEVFLPVPLIAEAYSVAPMGRQGVDEGGDSAMAQPRTADRSAPRIDHEGSALTTALIVAAISGVIALASAMISAWAQLRVKGLEQAAKEEEIRSQARTVLDRYRAPLVDAAWDLGDRFSAIIDEGFFTTYNGAHRREAAIQSTLFRVAQYLGWAEVIRRDVQILRLDSATSTRQTAYLLDLITRRFATGWYASSEGHDVAKRWIAGYQRGDIPPGHLMLWQEEQRGIGERMIIGDGPTRCMGYAAFLDRYDKGFQRVLAEFSVGLTIAGVAKSLRLVELRDALAKLVEQLDDEGLYVGGNRADWIEAARRSPCWGAYGDPHVDVQGRHGERSTAEQLRRNGVTPA